MELLRVICMLLLVAHHFAVHGGLLGLGDSLPKTIGLVFQPIGKICFIAFIAISMYFMVDGKNSFKRFFKCWLEVAFYSVLFTIITWSMGGVVSVKDFISSFFVMISNSHGFAASYLLFLLIYPFLHKATRDITKKQARYLLLVLFWIQIMSQIFKTLTGYNQPVYSELTLFIFCFVLSLNLKRYPLKITNSKLLMIAIVAAVWGYVFSLNLLIIKNGASELKRFLLGIAGDESSLFYILGGYALFYLFNNIRIPYIKWINVIASGTFGILLIHDHNFFRHLFWNEVVRTQTYFNNKNFVILFIATVVCIFIACSVIDFIRRELLEKKIVNSKFVSKISQKMDDMLKL